MSSQPQPDPAAPSVPQWYQDMVALVEVTATLENVTTLVDGGPSFKFSLLKAGSYFHFPQNASVILFVVKASVRAFPVSL